MYVIDLLKYLLNLKLDSSALETGGVYSDADNIEFKLFNLLLELVSTEHSRMNSSNSCEFIWDRSV